MNLPKLYFPSNELALNESKTNPLVNCPDWLVVTELPCGVAQLGPSVCLSVCLSVCPSISLPASRTAASVPVVQCVPCAVKRGRLAVRWRHSLCYLTHLPSAGRERWWLLVPLQLMSTDHLFYRRHRRHRRHRRWRRCQWRMTGERSDWRLVALNIREGGSPVGLLLLIGKGRWM